MQPALEDENFKEVSVFLGLGGNYLKRVYWSVLFSVLQARVLKSILAVRIHAMGTWRRQQQSQTMHGWRCKKDLLAVIDYRARRQEVAQERKRNESTTDLIARPGSACLLHSFSPFPVRHPVYGPGTCASFSRIERHGTTVPRRW